MVTDFQREYQRLNQAQRQAVDHIDGPLLVIAGPGTGKTQLLSARVANILVQTDTLPQNILCLTFTENGAQNMRTRLTRFIGQAAYNVTISTYHAFGKDLINRFPEYFAGTRLQEPVDDLGRHQILQQIVQGLSYRNPLKQTRHHLGDLMSTISEVKRALLGSKDLRALATENNACITDASARIAQVFAGVGTMPRTLPKALPLFNQTFEILNGAIPTNPAHAHLLPLAQIAANDLDQALQDAQNSGKTTPLTAWKNKWLAKDVNNQFVLAGELENRRIAALADVLEQYQDTLDQRGLYDFDDMIIRSIDALGQNADLKYTLQEQYLYLLLDEFQDTNAAQLRLIQLLSDNPVSEGRPNIMAVGDDDQAIYAFQGAQYSNMLDFYTMYRGVEVINLTENYRSQQHILAATQNIAEQISERLHHHFKGTTKTLAASNGELPPAAITRNEFLSDLAQYSWIATEIQRLVEQGTAPHEIAVLAPKHRHLEPLVAYLNALRVPLRYEKRENILETAVVKQLLGMSRLVLALRDNNDGVANALWPEVLSYDFWGIPTSAIWQLSWRVNDNRAEQHTSWGEAALTNPTARQAALLLLALAHRVNTEPCETMLDYLIGSEDVPVNEVDLATVRSPLRAYYVSPDQQTAQPELFYETLSHLKVLRERLRAHQQTTDHTLRLPDLLQYVAMYQDAQQQMINTSPYNQRADAVQLMTVFKAKGLEFEHVFLPSCHDDVWGSSSRGNANKLTLPPNLAPIRHAGATDDERLRLLFVALSRARFGLHLTSYTQSYTGKATKRLKYLQETEQPDGSFRTQALPEPFQIVQVSDHHPPQLEQFELDWRIRHPSGLGVAQLRDLLQTRLQNYKLSPTHLNTFLDVEYGGPEVFFFNTLLRFPQSPSVDGQFGSAIHETLEWVQWEVDKQASLPTRAQTLKKFKERLVAKHLSDVQTALELERGEGALTAYLDSRGHTYKPGNLAERSFSQEGVFVGDVHMSGKIDRLEIDPQHKTITVVDYKTGGSYDRWKPEAKLHKYRLQLYCYKLLVEHSHTYAGYTVNKGRLEFIEPDKQNRINTLELAFQPEELHRTRGLLAVMWQHTMELNFPDISSYTHNLKGMLEFEKDLLDETV